MEIKLRFWFCDNWGTNIQTDYILNVPENATEEVIEYRAEDELTDWFYSVALEAANELWLEHGGDGTDYEHDIWTDRYLEDCNAGWEYIGDYDDTIK